jgi:hypothetical protein
MGTCLSKLIAPIFTNPTALTNLSESNIPNNLSDPNDQHNRILSYFLFNEPDIPYTIDNKSKKYYTVVIPILNKPSQPDIIYSFEIGSSGCIYISNYTKNIVKVLYPNFSISEIRTNKYLRNNSCKFFMIRCNFLKNGRTENINYEYKFIKGIQYKHVFRYFLHNYQTLGIKKLYLQNKVYIGKIYSNLYYDKNKILIQNKYELHYCSKYFHYL